MFCLCSDIVMKRPVLVLVLPGPTVASSDADTCEMIHVQQENTKASLCQVSLDSSGRMLSLARAPAHPGLLMVHTGRIGSSSATVFIVLEPGPQMQK